MPSCSSLQHFGGKTSKPESLVTRFLCKCMQIWNICLFLLLKWLADLITAREAHVQMDFLAF